MTRRGNLFENSEAPARGERFEALHERQGLLIERIVSSDELEGADSDQPHDEWVLLLRGAASLEVDGAVLQLRAGDWLMLPAGTAHRVLRTERNSLWLAVHDRAPTATNT